MKLKKIKFLKFQNFSNLDEIYRLTLEFSKNWLKQKIMISGVLRSMNIGL